MKPFKPFEYAIDTLEQKIYEIRFWLGLPEGKKNAGALLARIRECKEAIRILENHEKTVSDSDRKSR